MGGDTAGVPGTLDEALGCGPQDANRGLPSAVSSLTVNFAATPTDALRA
jgi:hypothetical protein